MREQSAAPDSWLVFCDAGCPAWLFEEPHEIGAGLFDVVTLHEPWGRAPLSRAVAEVTDRPYLITTRLDSDDAIGIDFISQVQEQFEQQDSMYVNLLCGLQLDRSGQVFRYDYPDNPFISYIERVDGVPRTVFQHPQHGKCRTLADVRDVVSDPMWMQVIHGGNLMNTIRGPRVAPGLVERVVKMDLDYDRQTQGAALFLQGIASWVSLMGRWARTPGHARVYLRAQRLKRKGTTVLARG